MKIAASILVVLLGCVGSARADAIGPCPPGQDVVMNETEPGAMHHGGYHCVPSRRRRPPPPREPDPQVQREAIEQAEREAQAARAAAEQAQRELEAAEARMRGEAPPPEAPPAEPPPQTARVEAVRPAPPAADVPPASSSSCAVQPGAQPDGAAILAVFALVALARRRAG